MEKSGFLRNASPPILAPCQTILQAGPRNLKNRYVRTDRLARVTANTKKGSPLNMFDLVGVLDGTLAHEQQLNTRTSICRSPCLIRPYHTVSLEQHRIISFKHPTSMHLGCTRVHRAGDAQGKARCIIGVCWSELGWVHQGASPKIGVQF